MVEQKNGGAEDRGQPPCKFRGTNPSPMTIPHEMAITYIPNLNLSNCVRWSCGRFGPMVVPTYTIDLFLSSAKYKKDYLILGVFKCLDCMLWNHDPINIFCQK